MRGVAPKPRGGQVIGGYAQWSARIMRDAFDPALNSIEQLGHFVLGLSRLVERMNKRVVRR